MEENTGWKPMTMSPSNILKLVIIMIGKVLKLADVTLISELSPNLFYYTHNT